MPRKILFGFFRLALLLVAAGITVQAQQSLQLSAAQPVESEIRGGQVQAFTVRLSKDQTARVEIEQRGVDVSLTAFDPDGEKFIETESPSGMFGQDLILVTADRDGEYKVEVSTADPRAAAGRYVIRLAEVRPTTTADREINEAARLINLTVSQAETLRRQGTREGRRQAIEKWREIVMLSRRKQDKVWEAVAALTIGLIYEQLGELQKSLDFYTEGLRLTREIGNRQYEGSALNNLGAIHNLLGEREKSVFYYTQTLILRRETGDRRGEAITLNNLGLVYTHLGDYEKAEESLLKSLALRRELKDSRGEATPLHNLGQVYEKRGDAAKALDFFAQSLEIRRAAGDRQGEAVSLRNLGRVNLLYGDRAKGFELLETALALWKTIGDRGGEADAYYWLAHAERGRGNLAGALQHAQAGTSLIEQIRGEILSPELRATYFSTVQQFYELYADLLVSRFEKTGDPQDAALAFEMSEKARARSLIEILREARVVIRHGASEEMFEQIEDLQDALNAKYRQRALIAGRNAAPKQVAGITDAINSLHTEIENLKARLRRDNPGYAGLTLGTTLSAAEVRSLLDDETVLLEYKLGEARSFLWLVTKDEIKIFVLPARFEIEKAAKDFYTAVVAKDEPSTEEFARRLSRILIAPVAAGIRGKRAAVIAEGVLQYIPFSALAAPAEEKVAENGDKVRRSKTKDQRPKLLVETNDVIFLPSASVIAEIRRGTAGRRPPEKTIAVFADPIFDSGDPRIPASPVRSGKPIQSAKLQRTSIPAGNLPRLLASRQEARNILSFVPQAQADLKLDFEASRENATDESLAEYQILHFATHGLLDTGRPELSGLVFSLFDEKGNAQDGFLPLNQIYNLSLQSDLVVLSACQTALGRDVRGEGLIGLTRGFLFAGTRSVVASLWKVDDAATAEFMRLFYQNLLQKKYSPSRALQQAKVEMKRIPRFRAPYYWAGFVLQGDWQV